MTEYTISTEGAAAALSGTDLIPVTQSGLLKKALGSDFLTLLGRRPPQEVNTALVTVGAGTILAVGIAGGFVTRGGAQSGSAFTDTTDTATAIIAAYPNAIVNTAWEFTYQNNTNATATITGGTGVTVSAITGVPANSWARYLVTFSAAATVTMVGQASGQIAAIPPSQFVTAAFSVGTLSAGQITGAGFCKLQNTGATPGTQTTRTATQMLADIPGAQAGFAYTLRIINTGAGTLTLAGGTGVTVSGTATVATNVTRDYDVSFPTATTCTIQSAGSGVSP